jgi:hypothetical protein
MKEPLTDKQVLELFEESYSSYSDNEKLHEFKIALVKVSWGVYVNATMLEVLRAAKFITDNKRITKSGMHQIRFYIDGNVEEVL